MTHWVLCAGVGALAGMVVSLLVTVVVGWFVVRVGGSRPGAGPEL